MLNEFSFIEYLKKKIPGATRVAVGIGDDAAVVKVAKDKQLVISTDVIVENVDFKINKGVRHHFRETGSDPFLAPEKIGRKALAVNLSDMAAMGASPTAFVVSVGKPSYVTAAWLKRFYDGLLSLAKQYNVACVGGDFSRAKEFFASVTIFGEISPHYVVRRSGAIAGDWIAVTGSLGGSLLRHHCNFTPRVREGLFLAKQFSPSSMIDVSDGLVQDLSHILKASGMGAVLEMGNIPVSPDAKKMAKGDNLKALERALSDGEDFELLFTVTPLRKKALEKRWHKKFPDVPLSWIGRIEPGSPRIAWQCHGRKAAAPKIAKKGFSHF